MTDPNPDRDPLELLAAEYMDRLRQGQSPSTEEYAARHPELASEIRDLFPTIAATEQLKARQARSSGGRATLGPTRLERLGDFRIIREIGRGGMGVVFEAEHVSLGRRVAVKVLPRQLLLDEKHLRRFEREARIAANLHHTNIVEVFGVGEQDGFHYFVMQYIQGVGLDKIIPMLAKWKSEQADDATMSAGESVDLDPTLAGAVVRHLTGGEDGLPSSRSWGLPYWQNVARIGLQAAEALQYAHSQGVLHRDIKPANLLLGPQGTLWLADFGLAKAAHSNDLSLSQDLVGTVRYMAPEQFGGSTDHRSDLYSLGLTLYELVTLRSAFAETDHSRLIQCITQGSPPELRGLHPEIPRDLETIIQKAISHDANQRYTSAQAMADDLRCFLEDRPIHARPVGAVEQLTRWCRRNPSLASLTGTALFLLIMVAVVASVGYLRTTKARANAEANANLAIEALDRMFERFSPTRMRVSSQLSPTGSGSEATVGPILSKEAVALLEEMLPFYDRLAQQTGGDDKLRAGTAAANRRVGAIRQRLGQIEEATQAYRRAALLYEDLRTRHPTDPVFRRTLAQIENELGRIAASRRQETEAREAHARALALLKVEGASPSASPSMRFELARTYYFLGTQERPLPAADPRQSDRPAQASAAHRENLAKSIALLKQLPASGSTHPEYQHLLALCYLEGAEVEEDRTSPGQGGAERATEILEGLVKAFPRVPDYAFDLSEAYSRIRLPETPVPAEVQRSIEDRFQKSLSLLTNLLAAHPGIPDFPAAAARTFDKLGSFQRQLDRWADAEQNFRKAIALQEPLVSQFPDTPSYGLWMATFRIALADALIRRNQPAEARAELDISLAALLQQVQQKPELSPPHDLLALGYSRLAIALRQLGEKELAGAAARKAQQERDAVRRSP